MSDELLRPRNLQTAAAIDQAGEIVSELLQGNDPDRLSDALETAASDSDLAHAVMFRLLAAVRGWEETRSGVEFVAASLEPLPGVLWTPG